MHNDMLQNGRHAPVPSFLGRSCELLSDLVNALSSFSVSFSFSSDICSSSVSSLTWEPFQPQMAATTNGRIVVAVVVGRGVVLYLSCFSRHRTATWFAISRSQEFHRKSTLKGDAHRTAPHGKTFMECCTEKHTQHQPKSSTQRQASVSTIIARQHSNIDSSRLNFLGDRWLNGLSAQQP